MLWLLMGLSVTGAVALAHRAWKHTDAPADASSALAAPVDPRAHPFRTWHDHAAILHKQVADVRMRHAFSAWRTQERSDDAAVCEEEAAVEALPTAALA